MSNQREKYKDSWLNMESPKSMVGLFKVVALTPSHMREREEAFKRWGCEENGSLSYGMKIQNKQTNKDHTLTRLND